MVGRVLFSKIAGKCSISYTYKVDHIIWSITSKLPGISLIFPQKCIASIWSPTDPCYAHSSLRRPGRLLQTQSLNDDANSALQSIIL